MWANIISWIWNAISVDRFVISSEMSNFTKRNHILGIAGEEIASGLLFQKGHLILYKRYKRMNEGEIDIISIVGNTLVFTEVKTRQTRRKGLESIKSSQQKRIEKTALRFIQEHPQYSNCNMRFDVVICVRCQKPYHLENAWIS